MDFAAPTETRESARAVDLVRIGDAEIGGSPWSPAGAGRPT